MQKTKKVTISTAEYEIIVNEKRENQTIIYILPLLGYEGKMSITDIKVLTEYRKCVIVIAHVSLPR